MNSYQQYSGVVFRAINALHTLRYASHRADPVKEKLGELLVHDERVPLTIVFKGKEYYALGMPAMRLGSTPSICINNDTLTVRARTGLERCASTYTIPLSAIKSITACRLPSDYQTLLDETTCAIDTALRPPKQIVARAHHRASSGERTFEDLLAIQAMGTDIQPAKQ